VFIKRRNEEELADVMNVDWQSFRDPQSDRARRVQEQVSLFPSLLPHVLPPSIPRRFTVGCCNHTPQPIMHSLAKLPQPQAMLRGMGGVASASVEDQLWTRSAG
jgi:hypothetical protein